MAGITVFDPIGDKVGRLRDVVVLLRTKGAPRAVGFVVEVAGKRRVFLPLTRVTSIDAGQIITTGLLNIRRFEQRASETLAIADLLERRLELKDGTGSVVIEDLAMERQRTRDWLITKLFVRRTTGVRSGFVRKRGETLIVDIDDVVGLGGAAGHQSASMLVAAYDELKAADLADVLHEMSVKRRLEVASALDNERLADVIEELPGDDQIAILSGLDSNRAADVLDVMQPDDAADLLGDLPDEQAAALLDLMEPEEARDVRRLLAYEDDTAGGLMTTEAVILSPETPIATALAHVRRADLTPALASMVFVCRPPLETPTGRLLGVVHIQRMLREAPHELLGTITDQDIDGVDPDVTLAQLTRILATYNLVALPVVDEDRHLLGVVTVDDVLDHLLPEDWRESDDELTQITMGGTDA